VSVERPAFTLGVEEEFQIIDPETRELRSHVQELLDEGKRLLKERVKPEMHQSVMEIGTGICKDISEVRRDVQELRGEIIAAGSPDEIRVNVVSANFPLKNDRAAWTRNWCRGVKPFVAHSTLRGSSAVL